MTIDKKFCKINKKIKKSKIIKNIFGFLIIFTISYVFYFLFTGSVPSQISNKKIYDKISNNFGEEYGVVITEESVSGYGENSIFAFANDSKYKDQCMSFERLASPRFAVYDYSQNIFAKYLFFDTPIKKSYEFIFSIDEESDNYLWIYDYKFLDLDNNNRKELIIQMLSSVCGSGAQFFNLVFEYINGEYVLAESLPLISYIKNCDADICNSKNATIDFISGAEKVEWESLMSTTTLINKVNNKSYNINTSNTDNYIDFKDINNDNIYELVLGHPIWRIKKSDFLTEEDYENNWECHWCPHEYYIGVYNYKNQKYIIDNNWNSGLLYQTIEKISPFDAQGLIPIENNFFGMIGSYYLEAPYEKQGDNGFYTLSRKKSEILSIVEKEYMK